MDKKTLEEMKKLILLHRDKTIPRDLLYDLVTVFNSDPIVNGRVKVNENSKYDKLCVNGETLELFVDFDKFKETNSMYIDGYSGPYKTNKNDLSNYFYAQFILHELEHVKQSIYAMDKCHEYEVINDLYEMLNDLSRNASWLQTRRYWKNGAKYSFERNANMESSMFLYETYEDDAMKELAKVNYFFDALNGYENVKKGRVICPVEYTLKQYGIKYVLDEDEGIPFELAYSHGLYLDLNRLVELLLITTETEYLENVDFEKFRKVLRREK